MSVQTETCANCGRSIGALETPRLWDEKTVCFQCRRLLTEQRDDASMDAPIDPANSKRHPLSVHGFGGIVCPNPHCGYVGKPIKKGRGSVLVMIALLFIMVLPGVLYTLFMSGYDYFCPACGMKLRSEHR